MADNIVPWLELQKRVINKSELRENYIITQAVAIQALGRVGACFFAEERGVPLKVMKQLRNVDWTRTNPRWHLRTIQTNGRMITNEAAIILTSNVIKKTLGLPFTEDEERREVEFNLRTEQGQRD